MCWTTDSKYVVYRSRHESVSSWYGRLYKVNVNGGSIALGHPIGATGAILIGTILDELERRDLKRGLVTMCAAGGMAPAIIIERV